MMPGPGSSNGTPGAIPPGTDVDAIVEDLADNGVAAPGDQSGLAAVVDAAAAEHELGLAVVVLDTAGDQRELQALAMTLRDGGGGETVLVLGPRFTGAASDSYSGSDLDAATAGLPADDVGAAQAFVDDLTDPGVPWLGLVLAGAVLVAVVGGVGRWWEVRRRRRRDAAALAGEGERMRAEVAEMADEMLAIEPRARLIADGELGAEYSAVAVEYRDLTHVVERDPTDRRAADALAARVRALHERVTALDTATRA